MEATGRLSSSGRGFGVCMREGNNLPRQAKVADLHRDILHPLPLTIQRHSPRLEGCLRALCRDGSHLPSGYTACRKEFDIIYSEHDQSQKIGGWKSPYKGPLSYNPLQHI